MSFHGPDADLTWFILFLGIICVGVILGKLYIINKQKKLDDKAKAKLEESGNQFLIKSIFISLLVGLLMYTNYISSARRIINNAERQYTEGMEKQAVNWGAVAERLEEFAKFVVKGGKTAEAVEKAKKATEIANKIRGHRVGKIELSAEQDKFLRENEELLTREAKIPVAKLRSAGAFIVPEAFSKDTPLQTLLAARRAAGTLNSSYIPEELARRIQTGEVKLIGAKLITAKNGKPVMMCTGGPHEEVAIVSGGGKYDFRGNRIGDALPVPAGAKDLVRSPRTSFSPELSATIDNILAHPELTREEVVTRMQQHAPELRELSDELKEEVLQTLNNRHKLKNSSPSAQSELPTSGKSQEGLPSNAQPKQIPDQNPGIAPTSNPKRLPGEDNPPGMLPPPEPDPVSTGSSPLSPEKKFLSEVPSDNNKVESPVKKVREDTLDLDRIERDLEETPHVWEETPEEVLQNKMLSNAGGKTNPEKISGEELPKRVIPEESSIKNPVGESGVIEHKIVPDEKVPVGEKPAIKLYKDLKSFAAKMLSPGIEKARSGFMAKIESASTPEELRELRKTYAQWKAPIEGASTPEEFQKLRRTYAQGGTPAQWSTPNIDKVRQPGESVRDTMARIEAAFDKRMEELTQSNPVIGSGTPGRNGLWARMKNFVASHLVGRERKPRISAEDTRRNNLHDSMHDDIAAENAEKAETAAPTQEFNPQSINPPADKKPVDAWDYWGMGSERPGSNLGAGAEGAFIEPGDNLLDFSGSRARKLRDGTLYTLTSEQFAAVEDGRLRIPVGDSYTINNRLTGTRGVVFRNGTKPSIKYTSHEPVEYPLADSAKNPELVPVEREYNFAAGANTGETGAKVGGSPKVEAKQTNTKRTNTPSEPEVNDTVNTQKPHRIWPLFLGGTLTAAGGKVAYDHYTGNKDGSSPEASTSETEEPEAQPPQMSEGNMVERFVPGWFNELKVNDYPVGHSLFGALAGGALGAGIGGLNYILTDENELSEEEKKKRSLARAMLSGTGIGAGIGGLAGGASDFTRYGKPEA